MYITNPRFNDNSIFSSGIKKNKLDELSKLLSNDRYMYHKGYTADELRKFFIQDIIPSNFNEDELYELSLDILNLAQEGLMERTIGEEIFLKPLYNRIKEKNNPGRNIIKSIDNGIQIEKLIADYGKI